jgi:outer membrane receptor protein involved in Fe transport
MITRRFSLIIPCALAGSVAYAQQPPAATSTLEEVVVTAQRKAEQIQDVPIAVTAFSPTDLKDQRIETGANLAQAVPNMTFQPGAYAKPNFVIRGIGYQLVTSTGEAGVAIHVNDAPLTLSRIAQEDFFDVERIEVLRGPQGTLYGRNATGGVINVITKKPSSILEGKLTAEVGNYNNYKADGFVNVPMGDMFGLRVAGDFAKRDGYQTNQFNGDDVGNLSMWATRATLAFKPSETIEGHLMWEHFEQDDGGSSNGGNTRSICARDLGPTAVGTTSLTDGNANNAAIRSFESLGCAPTSIYNPNVLTGAVNGVGDFGNRLGMSIGLASGDLLARNVGPSSLYGVDLDQDPYNKSKNDLAQLDLQFNVSDGLSLSALATYSEDHVSAGAGGLRASTAFNGGATIASPQLVGGAPLAYWTNATYNDLKTEEYSGELRLQSSFSGPINFSAGGIYVNLDRRDNVMIFDNINKYFGTTFLGNPLDPRPASEADGGHYYYQSLNPYHLESMAAFGELYWSMTDTVRMTLGARYTDDKKTFDANTSASNLLTPGSGYTFLTPQVAEFKEPTGRLNFDWRPKLSFTDDTLLYASFSRGYKGGGFNPPNLVPQGTYDPEFVNALEIGTKNELLDRTLLLNMTAFYYDYKGYQFTQAAVFGTVTSNIDAHIYGAELETVWEPIEKLKLNAQVGYLNSEIQPGQNAYSIDQYNPTGGDPNLTFMKSLLGGCLVNTSNFARLLDDIKNGVNTAGGATVPTAGNLANTFFPGANNFCAGSHPEYNLFAGVPGGAGVAGVQRSIAGNRLPNVPEITIAVGVQYKFDLGSSWQLTPRIDYRHQGDIYTDLFNNEDNRVQSFDLGNATITLAQPDNKLSFQAYVKNITDEGAIIGASLGGGAILGNPRTITVANPRTFGVSVTKGF